MKRDQLNDLRGLSVDDLEQQIAEARRGLLKGRFAQVTEGTQRDSAARDARRSIARMLTIINEKHQQNQKTEVQA